MLSRSSSLQATSIAMATAPPRPLRAVALSPGNARSRPRRCRGRRTTRCGPPRGLERGEGSDSSRREPHPPPAMPKASCSGQTRSVGIVNARQRSPRISSRRYPRRRANRRCDAANRAMLSTFRRVFATSIVEHEVVDSLGMLDDDLAPELPAPARVAFENTYLPSRWPMSGSPNGSIRSGTWRDAEGRPDKREARHAARSV